MSDERDSGKMVGVVVYRSPLGDLFGQDGTSVAGVRLLDQPELNFGTSTSTPDWATKIRLVNADDTFTALILVASRRKTQCFWYIPHCLQAAFAHFRARLILMFHFPSHRSRVQ